MAPKSMGRSFRAPQEHGTAVVDPPFEAVPALVSANRQRLSRYRLEFAGRTLGEVAGQARRELIQAAIDWTRSYRDVDTADVDPSAPILLAGHQPELFHPGVWFKNLALARLAAQCGAVAVNLLIDTDAARRTSILVPHGTLAEPRVASIAMDEPTPAVAYEERGILHEEMFAEFGRRVEERIADLIDEPLICRYWPMVRQRAKATGSLAAALAQARHQLEGQWGFATLEVPESHICRSLSFAWFLAYLLVELPRLHRAYNECLDAYRRQHRIRNPAHPAANLGRQDDWLEAPFWIWTADNPRRRRLFVRRTPPGLTLADGCGLEVRLACGWDGGQESLVEQLGQLESRGVKIRCRALVTTLWARLALGDLFLHGIGGARYDQVTDALVQQFFGWEPPGFLVLSATILLPVARGGPTRADLRAIDYQLRELTWHPELYVQPDPGDGSGREAAELIAAKRRWVAHRPTPETARQRFLEIRRINQQLQPWVADQRHRLLAERRRTAAALQAQRVLGSREYAFCLFPEAMLRDSLQRLLPPAAE